MFHDDHIEHLRGLVADAERRLASARALLAYAQGSQPVCACGMPGVDGTVHRTDGPCYAYKVAAAPGDRLVVDLPPTTGDHLLRIGQPPYGDPAPTAVMPAQGTPSDTWVMDLDPKTVQAHERFEAAHDRAVCGDPGGSKLGGVSCALTPGHDGDHDDMLGLHWPRTTKETGA